MIAQIALTGSLLADGDPMLGGTTDIDVVLVHNNCRRLSGCDNFKLTAISTWMSPLRSKSEFPNLLGLAHDPYLGYEMYDPMLLSESEKFFEFVQTTLRAGFEFHTPRSVAPPGPLQGLDHVSDIDAAGAGHLQVRQFLDAL